MSKSTPRLRWIAAIAAAAFGAWLDSAGTAAALDDLSYGPDSQQVLDLKLPPPGRGPAPVVVFFHGGAFVGGDKHPCAPNFVPLLTARNIAFACANYRLAPRATYPEPMLDGARAIQWLRAHAAEYNLDPSRVAVMGMSAGAGIALWIAMHRDLADPNSPDPVLRQSTGVVAVVTGNAQATYNPSEISALLHTRNYPKFLAELFGAGSIENLSDSRLAAAEQDASPIDNMHAGEPPVLAYYVNRQSPDSLPPDSMPNEYIHHPAHGALLAQAARRTGASVTISSQPTWRSFLGEATQFLGSAFRS